MAIFRKNKRQFAYRSHRMVFVAMFLFAFVFSTAISLLFKASAEGGPVASVEFFSQNSSYVDIEGGAWKVTKSAEWTGTGKAKITFDVVSRNKVIEPKPKDVVIVIDDSWSMEGEKLTRAKTHMTNLVNALLDGTQNKVALLSFCATSNILSDFSNDTEELTDLISHIGNENGTSYYAPLKKIEELLENYTVQDSRDLIILFVTDGEPLIDVPNEVAEYQILKALYPSAVVNGILYDMGNMIPQELINVSDFQYVADLQTLYDVMLEATKMSELYSVFSITDYINETYWTISGEDAIEVDKGSASLAYDGSTPVIDWNMDEIYRSGSIAKMTVEVDLKNEYLDTADLLLPTNTRTIIRSEIEDTEDENIDKIETPILKDVYNVSYEITSPSDCTVVGNAPDTENHSIFATVKIEGNELTCDGYVFKGWKVATKDISYINDEYFIMPAKNVVVRTEWSKLGIEKSLTGTVNTRASATFDIGDNVNVKIRHLSGEEGELSPYVNVKWNTTITGIVRSATLSNSIDIEDERYIISSEDSEVPIYAWFDDGIIYFYTEADDIYLNQKADGMFKALNVLSDIKSFRAFDASRTTSMVAFLTSTGTLIPSLDPLADWDVSNVTDFGSTFSIRDSAGFGDYSALANWDISNATNISWMLSGITTTDLTLFSEWDVSKATNMSGLFYGSPNLTSLTGLEDWETGNVESMQYMFLDAVDNVVNLDPLADWDTKNVWDMSWMFYSTKGGNYNREADYGLYNIDAIGGWDVRKVKYMDYMFNGMNHLQNIDALGAWHTDSLEETVDMFALNDIRSVAALSSWNMSNAKYINYMFYDNENLTTAAGLEGWGTMPALLELEGLFSMNKSIADISAIGGWDVSRATSTRNLFYGTEKLKNVDALNGWTTTSLTNTSQMFTNSYIENLGSTTVGSETGMATWDMSHVTTMNSMFYGAKKLTNIDAMSNWTTSSLTDTAYMFDEATALTSNAAMAGWDMSHVTTMEHMFCSASSLSDISGVATWTLTSLENADSMFRYNKMTNLDALTNWYTPKLKSMNYIFQNATRLTDISGLAGPHWNTNTSNMTAMEGIFYNVTQITDVDDIAGWDVSNVTNMYAMFRGTTSLQNVDGLASWNTSKLSTMACMFYGTTSLSDITGISGWFNDADTSTLTQLTYVFQGNTALTNLNALANWKTPKLWTLQRAFYGMTALTDISGIRNWDTSKVTNMSEAFYNDAAITTLEPIYDWDTTKLNNMADTFTGIPDTVTRPSWYSEPDPGN